MRIIFVIGPACAGKSTYIKNNFPDFEVVDLYEFQKTYKYLDMDTIWDSYMKCQDKLIECIKNGKDVVLEHTLLRAIRRKIYIDAVRELGNYDIECICVKPDADTLVERHELRKIPSKKEWVEEELEILEIPTIEEGFLSVKIIEE